MSRRFVIPILLLFSSIITAADKPLREVIDTEIKAGWQRQKLAPAARCDDATFLRRVSLDLVGTIPTYDETVAFLNDKSDTKRALLIDKLIADPRFGVHQADVWDLVLFGRHPAGGDSIRNRASFKKWLGDKFVKNEPYDKWVRDLLLAEEDGSEMYYAQFRGAPEEATVQVSRLFLGRQLQCARCHDHPFDKWTQKDFYGMTGFFIRLVVSESGAAANRKFLVGEKEFGEVLFTGAVKDQKPGQKGDPVKPKFLGGEVLQEPPAPKDAKNVQPKDGVKLPKPAFSRKDKIAAWVTAKENPYFAPAVANRVWAQFMGRGIVHPVDDIGEKNTPSHPELLKALGEQMSAHNFDLKWYIRELVNSETYQMACVGPSKEALPKYYERARIRPLSAEEIMATFRQATLYDAGDPKTMGQGLPNAGNEYILRYFGEPTDGLGEFQGSVSEHLFLNNGNVWQLIRRKKGNLAETVALSKDSWEQKVDRLFLTVLNRPPTTEQKVKFVKFLQSDAKSDGLIEEAIWVLLNSAEFRFNH